MEPPVTPTPMPRLKHLIPFPDQHRFFRPVSDYDLKALADDIKENGLQNPIEIMGPGNEDYPANTIIRGHQRVRALLLNGETRAPVVVRRDLVDATAQEIEREFLTDNLNRRQLHPLEKARAALRLLEIEKYRPPGKLQDEETRERVGKSLGMSGRNLSRYLRILKSHPELQNACCSGRLSMVLAERAAALTPEIQQRIVEQIKGVRGDDSVDSIVRKFLPPMARESKAAKNSVSNFLKVCFSHLTRLQGSKVRLKAEHIRPYIGEVTRLCEFFEKLLELAKSKV